MNLRFHMCEVGATLATRWAFVCPVKALHREPLLGTWMWGFVD